MLLLIIDVNHHQALGALLDVSPAIGKVAVDLALGEQLRAVVTALHVLR